MNTPKIFNRKGFFAFSRGILPLLFLLFFSACTTQSKNIKPEIIQIEPSSGPTYGGYSLFIIGNGFDSKAEVTIGGHVVDDISIGQIFLVKVPQGFAGAADVKVVNPDKRQAILKGGFNYEIYPTITEIRPAEGDSAGGGRVVIVGDGFDKGATVRFGDKGAEVKIIRKNEIEVLSPPHLPGNADIVVTNPGGFSFMFKEAFSYH